MSSRETEAAAFPHQRESPLYTLLCRRAFAVAAVPAASFPRIFTIMRIPWWWCIVAASLLAVRSRIAPEKAASRLAAINRS